MTLLDNIDRNILVVCDEAYYEYVEAVDFPDTVDLMKEYPNLMITRTFSKSYGLAGLRIGYGMCHPKVVSDLDIVKVTFNTSCLAQVVAVTNTF